MDKTEKQPYERFRVRADFGKNITGTGETITSQSVSATDVHGDDASSIVVDQSTVSHESSRYVVALVRDGSIAYSPYKLTFRCETSLGHRWEKDFRLRVFEE